MHYLKKDETFKDHLGRDASLVTVVKLFAGQYAPVEGFKLGEPELRLLNKGLDVLEAEPNEGDYYGLEDEPFKVVKKTASAMMLNLTVDNVSFARDQPTVMDLLAAAPTEKPEAAQDDTDASLNGKGDASELADTEPVESVTP